MAGVPHPFVDLFAGHVIRWVEALPIHDLIERLLPPFVGRFERRPETPGVSKASGSDSPEALYILPSGLPSHTQEHILGFASYVDEPGSGQFFDVVGQRCSGDGDFRPQVDARNLVVGSCDPFKNIKSPGVDERSRDLKEAPLVHPSTIP